MSLENSIKVDLDPSLEARVQNDEEALCCVAGLAYMTAVLIESSKLPEFKQSLSMRLGQYLHAANTLTEQDFRGLEEVERAKHTSRLWYEIGQDKWEDFGVLEWSPRHTKVNVRRTEKNGERFILNIGPFGEQE